MRRWPGLLRKSPPAIGPISRTTGGVSHRHNQALGFANLVNDRVGKMGQKIAAYLSRGTETNPRKTVWMQPNRGKCFDRLTQVPLAQPCSAVLIPDRGRGQFLFRFRGEREPLSRVIV
jgi:hypothetical protein